MNFLSSHPIAIVLALASMVVWTSGNRSQNKTKVWIGIGLSAAATVAFVLGF